MVAKDGIAQIVSYIVGLERLFIRLSLEAFGLLHLLKTLGRDILDAGEEVHLAVLHRQDLCIVIGNILDGEAVYIRCLAPVIGVADKIPDLPIVITSVHIGPSAIGRCPEGIFCGQIFVELLAGYNAKGIGKAQFTQSIIVGLGQVKLHGIFVCNYCIFNNGRQAAIGAIILSQIHRDSQNRFCHIFRSQVRAIRKFYPLLNLEGIGFSILTHRPILGQYTYNLTVRIVLKQSIVKTGQIIGNVVSTGGGNFRSDDCIEILEIPAFGQV